MSVNIDTGTTAGGTRGPIWESGIWALLLVMMPVGVVLFLVPATINMVMKHFHLQEGLGGLQIFTFQFGFLISALTITGVLKKCRIKSVAAGSILCVFAFLLVAAVAPSYPLLLISYIFVGYFNGILFTLSGVYATHVLSKRITVIQGYSFGLLGLGYVVGSAIAGLVEYAGISWRWAIASPGLVMLPFVFVVVLAKLRPVSGVARLSGSVLRQAFDFDRKLFTVLTFSVFLAAGGYMAIVNWSVAFLENQRGMVLGAAHIVLAAIGLGVIVGRVMAARLAAKYKATLVVLAAALASIVLTFFAPIPQNGTFDSVLIVLACACSAGIYPILLGEATAFPASISPSVYTILTASVVAGASVFPFVIGLLLEHVGRVQGMCIIAAIFLLLFAMLAYKWRFTGEKASQ